MMLYGLRQRVYAVLKFLVFGGARNLTFGSTAISKAMGQHCRSRHMSDFPETEYQSGGAEPFELAPSLSFLQKIYRSPSQPIARRMRAAMAALQHEHPKLTTMAVNSMNGGDLRSDARPRNRPLAESAEAH
jgi:hypothetical protein